MPNATPYGRAIDLASVRGGQFVWVAPPNGSATFTADTAVLIKQGPGAWLAWAHAVDQAMAFAVYDGIDTSGRLLLDMDQPTGLPRKILFSFSVGLTFLMRTGMCAMTVVYA